MSATMARQGGWVQLGHTDMRLALNMAKMAKGVFSRASREETQHLIKNPRAEVREEKKRCVECPAHSKVKAAIEQHLAMVYEIQADGCLPCQYGTALNPQTPWRRKGTGAPPQGWRNKPTPEQTPPPPGTPPVPPGDYHGSQSSQIAILPARYVYIPTLLPSTLRFNQDASTKDSEQDEDFIPDLLTDEGTSTG